MLRRSSPFFALGKNKPTLITFISDVEGCLDYFHNYVSRSRVLQLNDGTNTNSTALIFKPEIENEFNCHFVFGGDAFDKGPGDIRFARQLFSFQDRYPGQVHFILGNRDTNKLKLRTELDMRFRDQFVLPQPYYLNEKAHVPYENFLENEKLNPTSQSIHSGNETQLERENILLLKYILKHRMGSGELFEYRRQELALGIKPLISSEKDDSIGTIISADTNISDLEVLNSFKQMSTSGGIYHEYVKRGKLALRVPDSDCVFVHGAINDDSFGLIPTPELQELPYASSEFHSKLSSETTQGTAFGIGADASLLSRNSPPLSLFKMIKPSVENAGIVNVDEWITELNNFKDKEVKDWEESPDFDTSKPNSRRGGASLFGYGHGRCIGVGTSVEVSTFVRKGEPQHIGFNTAVGLNLNGITRVAVGHQPIGDTPLVIAQPGLTTIMGDVSYGDKMHSNPPNGRGKASAEVLFYHYDSSSCSEEEGEENNESAENNCNKTVIHGVTSQGEEYEFTHQADDPFDVSGKRSKDGWWAIGKNTTTNQKVLARKTSDSFKTYEQKWFDEKEVREKGFVVDFSKAGEEGTEDGDDDLFYRQGFGQFFTPEYEAREDLKPTALPEKPQVEIKREENEKGGGYFGKNKVKPKAY